MKKILTILIIASVLVTSVAALKMSGKPTPFRPAPWVRNFERQCYTTVGLNDPNDPANPCGYHQMTTKSAVFTPYPERKQREERVGKIVESKSKSEVLERLSVSSISLHGVLGGEWQKKRNWEDYRWLGQQNYEKDFVPS